MSGINCSVIVSQPFSVACIFAYSMTIILPIMLALCLMLSGTYYAQNYASIIGWCLLLLLPQTSYLYYTIRDSAITKLLVSYKHSSWTYCM